MALARLDIPYVVAGRGLFETREVRDVFAMLRLVLDPGDRHALATVLRGPAVGLSDLALTLLSEPGRGLMRPDEWFGSKKGAADRLPLAEKECLRRFETHFRELRRVALGLGSADAIRYAIEKLDWDRVVAALPHAPQHLGNVERLIGLATKHGGSLPSFVRWLEQQIADQGDESEAAALNESDDAVALMTIHASKGLEFRAVVLVDMGVAVRATPLTLAVVSPRAGRSARLAVRHVHERGGSLYTPEAVELSKENMARELAERRRLTYVAMTRAKDRLFLLVPPLPANGSAAATMKRVLPELATMPGVAIESAVPYLLRLDPSRSLQAGRGVHPMQALPSPVRLPVSPGPLGISTTPLATFAQCPRRYRFLHELALEPPPFADSVSERRREDQDDRRALGTAAHRVLERWPLVRWGMPTDPSEIVEKLLAEGLMNLAPDLLAGLADNIAGFLGGPYATEVRTRDGVVYREERFLVPIACEGGELHLRGAIDLLVDWRDGSADVLDYKSSFCPELTSHEFQLRAYAVAVRRRFGISRIRAGILNLAASNPPTLTNLDAADLDSFEQILCDLRARFMSARASFDFAGVDRPECEALRCGFIAACHGG
jgi:ATP-dependent helicase/nuclease subunit A